MPVLPLEPPAPLAPLLPAVPPLPACVPVPPDASSSPPQPFTTAPKHTASTALEKTLRPLFIVAPLLRPGTGARPETRRRVSDKQRLFDGVEVAKCTQTCASVAIAA
jgi:hypothetical protein